jgi:hypothetical protein
MLNKPYNFTLVGEPNILITMYPTQSDLSAGMKSHLAGKGAREAEQLIRKRLMNRIHRDGGEGARLVPVN